MRTFDQIILSPQDRAAVELAAKSLRAKMSVEKIILFGSKARGDDFPDSDIDLLVLTRNAPDALMQNQMLELLYPLELELERWFGLMIVSRDDWDYGLYQAMPIRDEIERDGVEI